jgi:hypothetical protein
MVELRELGDEPNEEGRELGDKSSAWSATSLTRSDESSMKILQHIYVE